jgi:hypothetical protein
MNVYYDLPTEIKDIIDRYASDIIEIFGRNHTSYKWRSLKRFLHQSQWTDESPSPYYHIDIDEVCAYTNVCVNGNLLTGLCMLLKPNTVYELYHILPDSNSMLSLTGTCAFPESITGENAKHKGKTRVQICSINNYTSLTIHY